MAGPRSEPPDKVVFRRCEIGHEADCGGPASGVATSNTSSVAKASAGKGKHRPNLSPERPLAGDPPADKLRATSMDPETPPSSNGTCDIDTGWSKKKPGVRSFRKSRRLPPRKSGRVRRRKARLCTKLGDRIHPKPRHPAPSHNITVAPIVIQIRTLRDQARPFVWRHHLRNSGPFFRCAVPANPLLRPSTATPRSSPPHPIRGCQRWGSNRMERPKHENEWCGPTRAATK